MRNAVADSNYSV